MVNPQVTSQIPDWVKRNILDLPPGQWPLALVVLCAGILGFILLGIALKSCASVFHADPAIKNEPIGDENKNSHDLP
jgi:hypothetical protein